MCLRLSTTGELGGQFAVNPSTLHAASPVSQRRLAGCDTATRTSLNKQAAFCTKAMANGTVDFFNDTGGYGFIDTEDADDDVFFHMEDVGGPDLEEGQDVEFDIEQSPKGPRATNLTRL